MSNVVEQIDQKLGVYVSYLEGKGYDQASLEIILRDKKDAISKLESGGRIQLPRELGSFVPIGNPPSFMSGYAINDDRAYGMIFSSHDTAVNLLISGEAGKTHNPLTFMHTIRDKIAKILEETRDGADVLEAKVDEVSFTPDLASVAGINQINSILYNFLTDRPILIIGPVEEAVNILVVFLDLIPEKYRWRFGYSINMPYFPQKSVNLAIVENLPQYDTEEVVNEYLLFNHSLVNLYENRSFGDYTCSSVQKIVKFLAEEDLENARKTVEFMYTLAKKIQPGESAQEFGDREGIPYDDADLVLDIANISLGGLN